MLPCAVVLHFLTCDALMLPCAVAALHSAAARGNILLVRYLLLNGAHESIHAKNKMGCTPLDMARIFGPHPEVIVCAMPSTVCSRLSSPLTP